MENREFRDDLKEEWIRRLAGNPPVQAVTGRDMIRLTGHFAAGCAVVMGVVVLAIMVVMG
jgi:hypothetical protein